MKSAEVRIRDPYVLLHEGKYYLYGTRSDSCWGPMDGFDCYVGDDLENWEGPIGIFRNDGTFWADRCYWAPECTAYRGAFYLVATFKSATRPMGVQILEADAPTGPFRIHSDGPVTPVDWECLDGTLHFEPDGTPWLVFSRSFTQVPEGLMCAQRLSDDLSAPVGDPVELFRAASAPWVSPFPYAKQEFGIDGDCYLSDGPFLYRTEAGWLLILWSGFVDHEYHVGVAASDGGLPGPWTHDASPFLDRNGGHGMVFRTKAGELRFAVHFPNDKGRERPVFLPLEESDGRLRLREGS
jgi:hypothetical protein